MKFEMRITDYLLITALAVLVIAPVFGYGMPWVNKDLLHHLQISRAISDSWAYGTIIPNWVMEENAGYGAVTVRFYPPLMHASIALAKLVFESWSLAVFAAFAVWSVIGAFGIYLLARDLGIDGPRSVASAAIFASAPYRVNQFFSSAMFGEFASLSVLPFCFLFAGRVCDRGGMRNVIGLAASLALLFLSNLPQAVIGSICIGFYILLKLDLKILKFQLLRLAAAGSVALAASSFFWIRVVNEMAWLNISLPNTDPHYDYRNHFLLASVELDPTGIWLASVFLLLIFVSLVIVAAASGKLRSMCQGSLRPVTLLLVLSCVMTLPLTKFVWDNIAFLQKVQFPWRFLSVAVIASSILLGHCLGFVTFENFRSKRPNVLLIVGVIAIAVIFAMKTVALGAIFVTPQAFDNKASSSRSEAGLWHWWPTWLDKKAMAETRNVIAGGRETTITKWDPEVREFSIAGGEATDARVALLYYPHWQAAINGKPADVHQATDGAVLISIPPEEAKVTLSFEEPESTLLARQVSLWTWIGMAALLIFGKAFRRTRLK